MKYYRKLLNYIKNPLLIIIFLNNRGLHIINDKLYLKILFKIHFNKKLDLKNPKTFNEKLQWLKLYDRNKIYTSMVDKYEVKKIVSDIIGEEYIIPTIDVYDKFDDIKFNALPNQFVIKCTHDSGGLVIVKNKLKLDIEFAKRKITKNLNYNYYYFGREWPYKNVKPRIIVEKYMNDGKNNELVDYKLMCFNGKVKCIFTCTDRYSEGLNVTFFDTNWNKMPFERHYPASPKSIEKPQKLELMINLAEKLSGAIPFVRVDFYEINNKIYFGELTFYPGSGLEEFTPEEWDYKLGEWIILPTKKSINKKGKNEK